MIKYQSREFCRDIECTTQKLLDRGKEPFNNCENCEAYQFHKWLKNNGYKIIKDADDDIAELYAIMNRLYDFDRINAELGFNILNKWVEKFDLISKEEN